MKRFSAINTVGAPGSGCSTLGRGLAEALGYPYFDGDDFYWLPTDPPFNRKRDSLERCNLVVESIGSSRGFVFGGSVDGWGGEIEDRFDLVVFLSVPTEARLERIRERELRAYGRVDPDFYDWAGQYEEGRLPGRSRERHERWIAGRACRVLRIEGDIPADEVLRRVLRVFDD